MQLQQIESFILQLVGYDRYSDLSTSSDPAKQDDFILLHRCVNLAREQIKINSFMRDLYTIGANILSVANQARYSLPNDYDIPIKIYYRDNAGNITDLTPISILGTDIAKALLATNPNTPTSYIIAGTVANLTQIYLVPTPVVAGEVLLPIYKPVLTALSLPTDEDVIMRKYPLVVMDFATAYAWQFIKKEKDQFDKYMLLGLNGCKKITLREESADPNPLLRVEDLLSVKRTDRVTI